MRKAFVWVMLTLVLVGGVPAAHGLSGRDFGSAVSSLAKSYPGAVAAHVKN